MVVVCAAGAVLTVMQVGHRVPVLVLAGPVSVGQVLTAQDLRQVLLSADIDTGVIPASQEQSVLGQAVSFSLPGGSLLSRGDLGQPHVPAAGQAVVAVGVKPGQFPPDLAAGMTVSVIVVPSSGTGTSPVASGGPWSAVVTGVSAQTNDDSTVVSLQLPIASARHIAAMPTGQLSLMVVPAGGQ